MMENKKETKALILQYVRKVSEATRYAHNNETKKSLVASSEAEDIQQELGIAPEKILLEAKKLI